MTTDKHAKARVRARMARTGERYTTARMHVLRDAPGGGAAMAPDPATPTHGEPGVAATLHVGVNGGAAALRALLAAAGTPVSEPLALVLGGGIGLGVMQFHYAAEGVGTFYLAGRHRWDDERAFLVDALRRVGCEPIVTESTSPAKGERQLREALEPGGPVVAWVDAAQLGTRSMPAHLSGGGYHVLVVRVIDDAAGVAIVDDLAARPIAVPLPDLARARARIAKDRHRLLRLAPAARADITPAAVGAGLRATIDGFAAPRTRSFSLDALGDWVRRLRGNGSDAWTTVFADGGHLLDALVAIRDGIEHQGSGGGLVRRPFAAGLQEAAEMGVAADRLPAVAEAYDDLGRAWTDLAAQVLPDGVPALRRARQLADRRASLYRAQTPDAREALASSWAEYAALRGEAADCFPLDGGQLRAFLDAIAEAVEVLHGTERAALERLRSAIA
jgi:hypothetical protein